MAGSVAHGLSLERKGKIVGKSSESCLLNSHVDLEEHEALACLREKSVCGHTRRHDIPCGCLFFLPLSARRTAFIPAIFSMLSAIILCRLIICMFARNGIVFTQASFDPEKAGNTCCVSFCAWKKNHRLSTCNRKGPVGRQNVSCCQGSGGAPGRLALKSIGEYLRLIQYVPYGAGEVLLSERFHQVPLQSQRPGLLLVDQFTVAGAQDYRYIRLDGVNYLGQLNTGQTRHGHIGDQ